MYSGGCTAVLPCDVSHDVSAMWAVHACGAERSATAAPVVALSCRRRHTSRDLRVRMQPASPLVLIVASSQCAPRIPVRRPARTPAPRSEALDEQLSLREERRDGQPHCARSDVLDNRRKVLTTVGRCEHTRLLRTLNWNSSHQYGPDAGASTPFSPCQKHR